MTDAGALATRELDIVIFGATGDTGVVGCCYLFFHGKQLGITSWAPAARNASKLQSDVLDRLATADAGSNGLVPCDPIIADSSDYESMVKMCARTKCVIACAGPFSVYGEGVVRACVETGTNYVDVTGEIPWVEKMQRKYGEEADKKGVTMISCAGYDSIPPDLTTNLAAQALQSEGERLHRFEAFVGGAGGAMPTGTLNTVLQGVDQGKRQLLGLVSFGLLGQPAPSTAKPEKQHPALSSGRQRVSFVPHSEQSNLNRNSFWNMLPAYSSLAGQFSVPHFMAPINVNTVHRTAAQEGYGGLEYRERMAGLPRSALALYGLVPTLVAVVGATLGSFLLLLPGSSVMALKLRDRFNTPLQQQVRDRAFSGFRSTGKTYVHGYGVSKNGQHVDVDMSSSYDPGLGFTMLSACVVAAQIVVHLQNPDRKAKPGFNTAVVALGGSNLAGAFRASGVSIEVRSKL